MDYAEHNFQVRQDVIRELNQFRQPKDLAAIRTLAFEYFLVAGSIYLTLAVSYWLYPIALIIIGSVQRTFANILHESAHGLLANNNILNLVGGTVLTSYLIFHMFTPYRNSHVGFHHRHFGDPKDDPDYNFHILLGLYEKKESHARFILKNLVLALIGYRTVEYIKYIYHDRLLFSENIVDMVPCMVRIPTVLDRPMLRHLRRNRLVCGTCRALSATGIRKQASIDDKESSWMGHRAISVWPP